MILSLKIKNDATAKAILKAGRETGKMFEEVVNDVLDWWAREIDQKGEE